LLGTGQLSAIVAGTSTVSGNVTDVPGLALAAAASIGGQSTVQANLQATIMLFGGHRRKAVRPSAEFKTSDRTLRAA